MQLGHVRIRPATCVPELKDSQGYLAVQVTSLTRQIVVGVKETRLPIKSPFYNRQNSCSKLSQHVQAKCPSTPLQGS